MNTVNALVLARLANKDLNKAVSDFGALPLDIRESLTRQMNEQRQEAVDAAAEEIVMLLHNKDVFLVENQATIEGLKQQIAAITAVQESVALATRYGLSTQNFLPLNRLLGGMTPSGIGSELTAVPKNWAEPTQEVQA